MLNTIALETWKRASQNLISLYQLRLNRVLNQSAKHLVFVKGERYEIETIQNSNTFYAALKLRRAIKKKSVAILELSRLFLLPEHNHKEMTALAARFLSQYSLAAKTELIISNKSINSGASRSAALVNEYFNSVGLNSSFFKCHVQDKYQIPNYQHWNNYFKNGLNDGELIESAALLPPVFRDSLKIGATIAAPPGFDRTTNRIDFLTILHKEDLNRSLWKQLSPHSELSIAFSYFLQ